MKRTYLVFQVKLGWMGFVRNEQGIERIYLPGLSREDLEKRIQKEYPESQEGKSFLDGAKKELVEYFDGRRSHFGMDLDLSRATPFRKKVYKAMSTIPLGEVRTYRWLAQKIGNPNALRAVGSANAHNQWPPVIPCHRIVGSDGGLTGFSAPGGLKLKEELLKLEGVAVAKGRAKLKRHRDGKRR